jgi:hypothetical protein
LTIKPILSLFEPRIGKQNASAGFVNLGGNWQLAFSFWQLAFLATNFPYLRLMKQIGITGNIGSG